MPNKNPITKLPEGFDYPDYWERYLEGTDESRRTKQQLIDLEEVKKTIMTSTTSTAHDLKPIIKLKNFITPKLAADINERLKKRIEDDKEVMRKLNVELKKEKHIHARIEEIHKKYKMDYTDACNWYFDNEYDDDPLA